MIKTKADFRAYMDADARAMGRARWDLRASIFDMEWRYERALRKLEYLTNCDRLFCRHIRKMYARWRLHVLMLKTGIVIQPNCFGPGLSIAHAGTIIVHPDVRIGRNCRIHACVNIGMGNDLKVPRIGNNCYIGPGAKLFGGIVIGDNVKIGANAVVNKSFTDGNCTLIGIPAREAGANCLI